MMKSHLVLLFCGLLHLFRCVKAVDSPTTSISPPNTPFYLEGIVQLHEEVGSLESVKTSEGVQVSSGTNKRKRTKGRPVADLSKPLLITESEKEIIGRSKGKCKNAGTPKVITEAEVRKYRMRRSEINRQNYQRRKLKWGGYPSKKAKEIVVSTKLMKAGKGSIEDIQKVLENRERLRLANVACKERKAAKEPSSN
ncbi:uncharacterized protein FA14DRAFT_64935 [Meira miltonrushii]|uniref:Uncharacterized protein n=1 Tax=Meira miltonrushii TaxID=1280837 RepID=A0A316VBU9_9BASI|nr:uncharacterized protein FA14DRAFT_64935 [Meira miltonrushii]PWN33733.1 hypothetical protein FA14DRAFT_64935 [Meira miltonrushii]